MPVLKDFRRIKKISLPSIEGSEIEIYDSILVGDVVKGNIQSAENFSDAFKMLPYFIKSWNFTNEAGETLEICSENLGILRPDDITFIMGEIDSFVAEVKKN